MKFGNVMKASMALVVAAVTNVAYALDSQALGSWENVNYYRSVDLSRSYVKESCLIEIKNVGSKALGEYYFSVNDGFGAIPHISAISFSAAQGSDRIELEAVKVDEFYKVQLPVPVSPNSATSLQVNYIYIDALQALPAKIKMSDTQQVLLQLNKFAYSGYKTKHYTLGFTGIRKGQEMELFLDEDVKVTANTPELKPRVENKALVYGPLLEELEPFTVAPMGLYYDHNSPLTYVENLNRSIWIPASQVEQLPVEEYYELTNKGAELSTGFSRVDWMKGRYDATIHWATTQFTFPFTSDNTFDDYYYTDLVGLVSTHSIVKDHLVLVPRFPVFGGWHYNFTLGWNYQLSKFIHKVNDAADTYIARAPIVNSLRDVSYNNVYLQFYLPEHAEFIDVASPIEYESISVENELSYLDVSGGHVKVTLHYAKTIDAIGGLDVFIKYSYTQASYWYKIAKISGFVFVGLVSYYLLGLVDLTIDKKRK